jgi:hypothetical protein
LETQGTIIESYIIHIREGRPGIFSESVIQYNYTIKGKKYQSTKIRAYRFYRSRKAPAKYPIRKIVSVYYNPTNPASAALEPGIYRGLFMWFIVSLICFAMVFFVDPPSGEIVPAFRWTYP